MKKVALILTVGMLNASAVLVSASESVKLDPTEFTMDAVEDLSGLDFELTSKWEPFVAIRSGDTYMLGYKGYDDECTLKLMVVTYENEYNLEDVETAFDPMVGTLTEEYRKDHPSVKLSEGSLDGRKAAGCTYVDGESAIFDYSVNTGKSVMDFYFELTPTGDIEGKVAQFGEEYANLVKTAKATTPKSRTSEEFMAS